MSPLTLDLWGFGGHCEDTHAKVAHKAGFLINGVYDLKQDRMDRAQAISGRKITMYKSPEELLQTSTADAIIIATLDPDHPEHFLQAASAGKFKGLIIEKPIFISDHGMRLAREAFALCRKSHCVATSCHPRDYDPRYQWLQNNLGRIQKEIGKIKHIKLSFTYPPPKESWKKNRSLTNDHWSHEIRVLRQTWGKQSFTVQLKADKYNEYHAEGTFGDIPFVCKGDRKSTAKHFQEWVILEGEKGRLELDCHLGIAWLNGKRIPAGGPTYYDDRSLALMKNFAQAIRSGKQPIPHDELLLINNSAVQLVKNRH